jgi:hypothetical protein
MYHTYAITPWSTFADLFAATPEDLTKFDFEFIVHARETQKVCMYTSIVENATLTCT